MALNAPVGLSGEDRGRVPFTTSAKATNLNLHGAAIRVDRELVVGSTVLIRNQRGTEVLARVVAQLASLHGGPSYAIEFLEEDERAKNFWGIAFPSLTK